MRHIRWALGSFGIPVVLAILVCSVPANAALITGWGAESNATGGAVTDDTIAVGPGDFHTGTPTGNLAPRALLPSTLTLTNVGDEIVLTGQVAMANAINGNESLRFGLFNSNGNAQGTLSGGVWTGSTPTDWLGYMIEIANLSAGNGNTVVVRRNTPSNTGSWYSGTGATTIQSNGSATLNAAATYNFSLTLTLATATSINVAYTFADTGGTISLANSFTDTTISTTSYNAVGFLENTSSGGAATYTNVAVNYVPVPEPASAAIMGLATLCLLARRRHSLISARQIIRI